MIQKLHTGLVVCRWPVLGNVVLTPDGKRHYDWPDTEFDVAIQWREPDGQPIRLFLGHPKTGPLLCLHSRCEGRGEPHEWNSLPDHADPCWSRGNYGKNCACGGNWSSWRSERSLAGPPLWRERPTVRRAFAIRMDRGNFSDRRLAAEPPVLTDHLWDEFAKLDTVMPGDEPVLTRAIVPVRPAPQPLITIRRFA